jgi:hypothetical protein
MGLEEKLNRDRAILISLVATLVYCLLPMMAFFFDVTGFYLFILCLPPMISFAIIGTVKKYYHDKEERDYSEKSYSSSNKIEDFVLKNNDKKM